MRRPINENIISPNDRSFHYRFDSIRYSEEMGYHVHSEMEIAMLKGGSGVRIANEVAENFEGIDIAFIPAGMPHCWIFDPLLCREDELIDDICCQFKPCVLKNIGNCFPEMKDMVEFYLGQRQALVINGATAEYVRDAFYSMRELHGSERVLAFLNVLNRIYLSGEFRPIGLPKLKNTHIAIPRMRFHIVSKLITENYSRRLTLSEAADAVNLSPTAFCNAFKATTGTTFNNYLLNYRMQAASKLLSTTLLNISEIAYLVGFNDAPHFSRTFAKYFKMSPRQYRNYSKGKENGPQENE